MTAIANNQKFHGLDVLRGVLAIIVCIAHSWQVFIAPSTGTTTWAGYVLALAARFAVLWFFCLSGYVISLSIAKNIELHKSFNSLEYALSRGFRVIPALVSVILIVFAIAVCVQMAGLSNLPSDMGAARTAFEVDVRSQFISLLTLGALRDLTGGLNGPLWSLQYELQLYTVMGLAAVVLFDKSGWRRLAAIGTLLFFLKYAFHLRSLAGDVTSQILWFAVFGCGVVAYVYFRNAKDKNLRIAAISCFIACLAICYLYPGEILNDLDTSPMLRWAQIFMGIGCTAMIILISRAAVSKRLGDLGKFGYTLYILHFPILLLGYFVFMNGGGYLASLSWAIAALSSGFCIVLSYVLSGYIENASAQRKFFRKTLRLSRAEVVG